MVHIIKYSVLLLFILLGSSPVIGQTVLSGKVLDSESQSPIIGAYIVVKGTNQGGVSDIDGNFSVNTTASLPITIVVTFIGYETKEVQVASNTFIEVLLDEGITLGNEVVITASRSAEKASEAPASISIIDERKLRSQSLMSPVQALRNLHGIDVSQQGVDHFQVNLRGRNDAFSTETYFMKDYRSLIVPGQGIMTPGRTSLNDLDLDRIEVVRGPGSALYGPGVETGVVHFISKSPIDDEGTSMSIGTGTQSNLSLAGRYAKAVNDKFGFKLVAHYNQANDFALDPDDPIDRESLAAFPDQVISGKTGELLRTSNELETKITNYSISGEIELRPSNDFTLHANAGYNYRRGLVRANLGEALQDFPSYFAQVRIQSDNLFAQAYMNVTQDDSEESVLYRTGLTSISKNKVYQGQVQYDWPVIQNELDITFGTEAQLIRTDTEGTVHGRFEDEDEFDVYSLYSQVKYRLSPKINILGAVRMDRFSAIEETTFSPRAGLVFKATPTQSVRFTFNRAITSPSSLFIFADIPFGVSPAFDIPFLGGIQPIEFSNPPNTTSLIPGVGQYPGLDMPLSIPYSIALAGLSQALPPDVISYLSSKLGEINGTTAGVPLLNGQPVTSFPERGKIRSTKTNAYELGYKGVFGGSLAVGLDLYFNRREDLIFTSAVSLLVVNPNLTSDLVNELNRVIDPDELSALGLTQQDVVQAFAAVGDGLAANALGLVQPNVDYPSGNPQFIVTPSNTGEVNYFGADLSLQYYFDELLTVFANYSWLSQNLFSDEDIGLGGTGQTYSLNTPKNRIRIGASYIPSQRGFTANVSLRHQGGMEVLNGTIFSGPLDPYTIVDVGAGYNFGNGLRINITGQNILDSEYRVMPRMPKIGRFAMVKATVEI